MRKPDLAVRSSAVVIGLAILLSGCATSSSTKAPAKPQPSPPPPSAGSATSAPAKGDKPPESGQAESAKKEALAKSEAGKQGQRSGTEATGSDPQAEGGTPGELGAGTVAGTAKTPDERRAAGDARLQAAMAEFDGMLLKEQKVLEEKQRKDPPPERGEGAGGGGAKGAQGSSGSSAGQAGGGGGQAGSTGNKDDKTPGERRAEAEAAKNNKEGGDGSKSTAASDKGTGTSKDGGRTEGGAPVTAPVEGGAAGPGSASASVPPDVGDGRNDDVVARQLREAATKEKDPAIRAKLWDEYREYKKSAGKGGL